MSREGRILLLGWAVLWGACLLFVGRGLDVPGLYYDEVIQATPAAEYLREGGEPLGVPGARSTWLAGGWFPLMTQPYMGALKSQLLIPVFAVFGASGETLRATTLVWAGLGLLLVMGWIRALFGLGPALATGALVAADPSSLFVARHDWGSAALALVCRAGGLWLVVAGWPRARAGALFAGGLLLGLGVYNKIDFAAWLAAAALAAGLASPRRLVGEIAERRRAVLAGIAGGIAGAAPMLVGAAGTLAAAGALWNAADGVGDWTEKLVTWATWLDGSHFHRLMLSGGRFEALARVEQAAAGPFGWIFAASFAGLSISAWRGGSTGPSDRALRFVLLATPLVALALLLTPRAARIHHVLLIVPLPQLVVALAAQRLWRRGARTTRAMAAAGLAAALAGGLWIDHRVLETLRESGGRGRWSLALGEWARELPPGARVVSLDWGFHAPLRLLRPGLELEEPFWRLALHGGVLRGGPQHVYLVQEPEYAVFPVGGALLAALEPLPDDAVEVTRHVDGAGGSVFRSVRFARPHELVYRGRFEVRLR